MPLRDEHDVGVGQNADVIRRRSELLAGYNPGLEVDEEIVWTATNAIKGVRLVGDTGKGVRTEFPVVDFDLTYLGVLMGRIRATGLDKNQIEWKAIL